VGWKWVIYYTVGWWVEVGWRFLEKNKTGHPPSNFLENFGKSPTHQPTNPKPTHQPTKIDSSFFIHLVTKNE